MKRNLLLFAVVVALAITTNKADAAIFNVSNTLDSGAGSLRAAIDSSNATAPGPHVINFNIPSSDPNCSATTNVCTITLTSALPTITRAVTIDGYSQPGSAVNTQATGTNALPLIRLTGPANINGLTVTTSDCVIKGLVLNRFSFGILFTGASATGNRVEGCFIGPLPDGTTAQGNDSGIRLELGANNNTIGGTALAQRNLISANSFRAGIEINGNGTDNNVVLNNLIGTTRTGNAPLNNGGGIIVFNGSKTNRIGGTAIAEANLISGNNANISLSQEGTNGMTIQGNFIGTNAAGTAALWNGTAVGINIESHSSGHVIGGTAAGARNIISGNGTGITLSSFDGVTYANTMVSIVGNYIGTDVTGTVAVPNRFEGIQILGASSNTVFGNVISGNEGGISLNGNFGPTNGNQIMANRIGVDVAGASLPNEFSGVFLGNSNVSDNVIGGTVAGQGNIIANNGLSGIRFGEGESISGNSILGNSIYDNVGPGISLTAANDDCDADSGANDGQNFPILSSVTTSSSSTQIEGSLNSAPDTTYRIEFFANPQCDESGFGEGRTFIGTTDVTTDTSCNALFSFTAPVGNLGGQSISATATNYAGISSRPSPNGGGSPLAAAGEGPLRSTSGFSPCLQVPAAAGTVQFSSATYEVNEGAGTVTITVTRTGDTSGETSVHYTTGNGSATATSDYAETSGDLSFLPSETSKTFTIGISDDAVFEPNETFNIALTAPVNATVGTPSSATVTITENDAEPTPTPTATPTASPSPSATPTASPTPSASPSPTPTATPFTVQLLNISGRAAVGLNEQVSIAGFIVKGGNGKRVIARGIGPSLTVDGAPLAAAMQDPILELRDGSGELIRSNDNWRGPQESDIEATGLAPTDNREAAVVATLNAGEYTAISRGANESSGVGLIEIYDLEPTAAGELANLSVRARVLTNDNVLINGLILRGGMPRRVLFRAIGPDLSNNDTAGALQNPTLDLHGPNGELVASNDNWRDAPNAAEIEASGLAPDDDRESAILLPLPPANYTSIVRGVGGTNGIALAEAYNLD